MESGITAPSPAARVGNLLALGWVAGVAACYLGRYDGWLAPVQALALLWHSIPSLRVGPYFGGVVYARFLDFVYIGLLSTVGFGLGAVVVAAITRQRDGATALFALGLGLWVIATAVLMIGAVSIRCVPVVVVGGLAWLVPGPRQFLRQYGWPLRRLEKWEWVVLAALLAAMLLTLPGAMAPPFEYDELEYHLGAPADYLRAGRIVFLPYNVYSNLPQLTEMLYLPALILRSGIAAKLLHWSFGVMTAVVIGLIGSRLWSRRVGLLAALLFYGVPFVQDLSQTARVDLATTFYGALAFGGLLLWRAEARGEWRTLAVLAAGAAVATKWTAIPVVLLPTLFFVLIASRSWSSTLACLGLGLVPCLPWLVKNMVLAGNPVYPLFATLLPSPHWSVEQAALFAQKHQATLGPGAWRLVFERAWRYSMVEPLAVPACLMTAPALLFIWSRLPARAATRRAVWLFVAGYLGWLLLTFRPWRFVFPVLPLAALLGAVAVEGISERSFRNIARTLVGVVVATSLALMLSVNLMDAADEKRVPPRMSFAQYALGQLSPHEFIAGLGFGVYEPILWMNEHLPARAKVLYVGEARTYYARHVPLWSTAFDQHPLAALMQTVKTPADLAAALRARGILYIYVNGSEWQRLYRSYWYPGQVNGSLLMECLQHDARPVHVMGRSTVYELLPGS